MKRIIVAALLLSGTILLQAQKVGIGTNTPLMQLHVSKSDSAVLLVENTQVLTTNTSTAQYFRTGASIAPYYTGAIKTVGQSSNTARLGFFTFASPNANELKERMSISDDGKTGMGTITPQTALHINPAGPGSVFIGTNRSTGGYTGLEAGISAQSGGYGYVQATKASGSSYGNLNLNPSGGYVGVGTTNPHTMLDVHGGIALPIKVVTSNYAVQDGDYTIIVNMRNSLSNDVYIFLPAIATSAGRVIRIISDSLALNNFTFTNPGSAFGNIRILTADTVAYELLYARSLEETHSNGSGISTHTSLRDIQSGITLQCTGTSPGWYVIDKQSLYNYYEDHYPTY